MNHEEPCVAAFSSSEVKLFRYLNIGLFEHNSLKSWAFLPLYFPLSSSFSFTRQAFGFSGFDFTDKNRYKIRDARLFLVWDIVWILKQNFKCIVNKKRKKNIICWWVGSSANILMIHFLVPVQDTFSLKVVLIFLIGMESCCF